ncbi:MAG TPA: hypothetical protein PLP05_05960 [Sedimentisphaerales bacterium]|nr:hypothetical protein [Sedimentisphaerales bacterium]
MLKKIADYIIRFSLVGIRAIRQLIETGELNDNNSVSTTISSRKRIEALK